MHGTVRVYRAEVVETALDVLVEEKSCLSAARAPELAGPDAMNGEIPRNPEVGSMADGLDMNGPGIHSHRRVTPAGSLRRFWRYVGQCGC